MSIYYAIVDGDPLTSGPGSCVYSTTNSCWIKGPDGRSRCMVFIGDPAWCSACKSKGTIIGTARVPGRQRMVDLVGGGRRQAVNGDSVLCGCSRHPQIIAKNGCSWRIHNNSDSVAVPAAARAAKQTRPVPAEKTDSIRYDDRYILLDPARRPIADTRYAVQYPDGQTEYGITDAEGHTHMLEATASAKRVRIYVAQ